MEPHLRFQTRQVLRVLRNSFCLAKFGQCGSTVRRLGWGTFCLRLAEPRSVHNTLPGVSSAGSAVLFYRYAGIEPPVATRAACPAYNSPAQSFQAAGLASLHWRGCIGIFMRCVELGHRHPVCVRQRARPSAPRVLAAHAARPTSFCASWASLRTPLRTSFALLNSCQGTSFAQQVSEIAIAAGIRTQKHE